MNLGGAAVEGAVGEASISGIFFRLLAYGQSFQMPPVTLRVSPVM